MRGNFLRGFIDGSLSTLGIVIGASAADTSIIVAASTGGTLANGISNIVSAFSAERADHYAELRKVEGAMVDKDLKESALESRMHKQTLVAGIIDGLATILGGALPILPYLFIPPNQAMVVSILLVLLALAVIGIYLGKLSRRNILFSALKMAAFGIVAAAAVYLVQSAIVPQ